MTPQQRDWLLWQLEIRQNTDKDTTDRSTVFIRFGTMCAEDGSLSSFYAHNGTLFVIQDNDQPRRWPVVRIDSARLGLAYNPDTNADDAKVTVALPHGQLHTYAIHIKDLFHPGAVDGEGMDEGIDDGWAREVRVFRRLSKKHPHPGYVRYLGCRVAETPSGEKRITGIVLEKLQRSMANYDPDDAAFRDLDTAVFLQRLEHVVLFLHFIGLAHNDLKPGNVLLRDNNVPVLIDFESCAPPGTLLHTHGMPHWRNEAEAGSNATSVVRFENDLYALRLVRERIGDKDAVKERLLRVGGMVYIQNTLVL